MATDTEFTIKIPHSKITSHRTAATTSKIHADLLADLISGLIASGHLTGSEYILGVVEERAKELARLSENTADSAWNLGRN